MTVRAASTGARHTWDLPAGGTWVGGGLTLADGSTFRARDCFDRCSRGGLTIGPRKLGKWDIGLVAFSGAGLIVVGALV
jgi:hypothetical protein